MKLFNFISYILTPTIISAIITQPEAPKSCQDVIYDDNNPAPTDNFSVNNVAVLADDLSAEVANRGDFYDWYVNRLIGGLKFSQELVSAENGSSSSGSILLNYVEALENTSDSSVLEALSTEVKKVFIQSFLNCQGVDCISKKFCQLLISGDFGNFGTVKDQIKTQLLDICYDEGWRLNDILENNSVAGVFKFDSVPVRYTDCGNS